MPKVRNETNLALAQSSISLFHELVAYEALWNLQSESMKSIAERFAGSQKRPSEVLGEFSGFLGPSDLVAPVEEFLAPIKGFSVLLRGCFQYPARLRDARHPIELLYYRGDIGLLDSKAIAVVGARDCSEEGKAIAARIAKKLVMNGYSISSGLAKGIDTAAIDSALQNNGNVIGVIGTPIDQYYPKENKHLQDAIAQDHLLLSHVPLFRYHNEPFNARRFHFPARNALMSAVSVATVIVEASDTSGTLTQARACLEQGRLLCITENCFRNPAISWPKKYLEKGAHRVSSPQDIVNLLKVHDDASVD